MVATPLPPSIPGVLTHAQQHPKTNESAHQRTAARADHRERDALGGSHSQHNGHIDQSLNDYGRGYPQGQVAPKIIARDPIQLESAPQDDQESQQKGPAAP